MNVQTNTAEQTEQPTLQDVEKKYFSSTQLEAGQTYIGEVMEICGRENVSPVLNFDSDEEFPAGYGLAVIPLTERVAERGNVTKGIAVAAIPDFEAVANDTAGGDWIKKQIVDAMIRQVNSAAKSDDGTLTSIPFSINDFVTSSRASGLAGFNAVAAQFVKALKKKGLKLLSKGILRQILASAAFAEQQYPKVAQESWVAVLDSMIKHAESEGVDTTGLKHWKGTRDKVEVDMNDFDLSDIDSLVDEGAEQTA